MIHALFLFREFFPFKITILLQSSLIPPIARSFFHDPRGVYPLLGQIRSDPHQLGLKIPLKFRLTRAFAAEIHEEYGGSHPIGFMYGIYIYTQMLNVWSIYLHLGNFGGKCS